MIWRNWEEKEKEERLNRETLRLWILSGSWSVGSGG